MRGDAHVRFGGAGRGNGLVERSAPRPGPTTGGTAGGTDQTWDASPSRSGGSSATSATSTSIVRVCGWKAICNCRLAKGLRAGSTPAHHQRVPKGPTPDGARGSDISPRRTEARTPKERIDRGPLDQERSATPCSTLFTSYRIAVGRGRSGGARVGPRARPPRSASSRSSCSGPGSSRRSSPGRPARPPHRRLPRTRRWPRWRPCARR